MSRRDNFRSSFGAQMPPAYPAKHFNDPRYNQSPPHVTPGSSYHGSPAQSPYGANGRGGWNGSHQYSPHGQYPPQHSQGTFAPPTGPQAQFHQNQSPPLPPTGPANPQGRGFSRGGFRGGNINPARGGSRGGSNLKSSPFGAPTGPAASRSHLNHSGESTPQHASPHHTASNHSEPASVKEGSGGDENPFRPSKDLQVEDSTPEKKDDEQMPPPTTRAPPTGPAAGTSGSKFSFAFKATSKAPVAAPKPEISQKFSAAPPRRDPQPVDDRSNRDRDLPRGVPTEPASSRARSEQQHNRHHLPETPRTRKVKKIERRLKPKPQLPPDLATSDSVFFRKPGNESVVGSGTYGKVFKGLHVYTKRLVALKKIRMEGERDGFPVTAVREIKLLQSLKHLNIVNLQEVMVEKNDCFMVFEYLSHDLTGLLNHPSFKLDAGQKKHLAKQLFEGLDYLHGRGVLHRDIKAANILVSSDGILKIADFGLARFYAKRHQLDYTNRVITIWYRSPELLLGETQYTAAVDVWSAACVLVEIFTRHAIFPGDGTEMSQLERIYAILGTPNKAEWPDVVKMEWFELLRPGYRKPNVFAEKYKERVPASAFELLASMFHYDPAKRPSAAEVLGHAYFTTEQPPPRQAIELADIQGDWHEFESKALRREKEKQDREARKAAGAKDSGHRDRERDKKRSNSSHEAQREPKRPHIESRAASSNKPSASAAAQSGSGASGAVVN
ncbi:kinase-like domain-containing protein [Pseudomassariella vexata]|uniref:cyclin-dependent kinase n=1 Tax=Pseudomassariella vexata TaxID=1141098 RepID=A0A1Y2EI21_9PEZI|nr:kinase-like domain-containing protein [Pseudomassariella vexata]ORY71218.1 kinase-like domain-containing protein [Pseudomassariella vexata]